MSIIINADDFGVSEDVNAAICECFAKKYIDRTTLMVNMPFADEAVRLSRENQFFEHVGLHLNLTSGKPLTKAMSESLVFCDESGTFHAQFHRNLKQRLYMSSKEVLLIQNELEAQIKKYLDYGFTCSHLDSHHHVHTNLPVLKALIPLILRYDIKTVRIGRNLFHKESAFNVCYKRIYNKKLNRMKVSASQYFGSYDDYVKYFTAPKTDKIEFEKKNRTEIMVHPMYNENQTLVDADLTMNDNWLAIFETRQKE